ncbi:site-specific integrase [Vibrio sp. D173a]|uniref:tyrosine-type recombinase/integrase n=1 Tax=Vibrio sp. D173a TaxID=2836349 RepID=UPI0025541F45|nr:site-specific integrase [Vibrio sp. D173a]MDK9757267.1 site-specific integrase [Vibrio sp. D173a]
MQQLNDLKARGYVQSQNLADEPNIINVAKRKRSVNVILAMKKNSWLAGCIRGATRKIVRSKALIRTKRSKASNIVRTDDFGGSEYIFPIDLCKKFIEEAPCLRDKVLYSLLAATGIRIHEALTMLIDDVFIQNGKVFVKVIDPKLRIKEFKKYYSEEKFSEISHKSRAIEATYLIEPFKSMLINYLPAYLAEERSKDLLRRTKELTLSSHRFLFRTLGKGKPMVFSYRSLLDRMHKHSIESLGRRYAFHSLRHMYGYYMANFCPRPSSNGVVHGFGLDIVQRLMGHHSSKSTERYAKQDHDLLEAMLSASNFCRNNDTDYSVIDAKISYLESKIRDLKLVKEGKVYA